MVEAIGNKKRIEWLDILKGFMMLFVIYGHITIDHFWIIYIYSFHMPVYFMLSGMTYSFNKEWDFSGFARKKFGALMLPYFVLNAYAAPFREWLERVGELRNQSFAELLLGVLISNGDSGYKMASNTTWFIPCLFLTTMFVFSVDKAFYFVSGLKTRNASGAKSRNSRLPLSEGQEEVKNDIYVTVCILIIIALALALGMNKGSGGIWHFRGAVFSMLFYQFGYLFLRKTDRIEVFIDSMGRVIFVPIALLLYAGYKLSAVNGYVTIIRNIYKNPFLFYISALLSCTGFILLAMVVSKNEKAVKKLRVFDLVGRKTLPYIALQVPIMKLVWHYIPVFGTRLEPYCSILTVVLFFGLLPLSNLVDNYVPKRLPGWKSSKIL